MFIRIICTAAVLILPAAISAGMIDFYLKWDDHSENITDISYLNHKPAGVSGPVAAVNGHTYINSETERIKFFAVNVTSSSCFPEKSYAPIIAKRMAKFGVNLARFHLADTWQWGESIFDYSGTGGTRTIDWSPGGTGDRMEYFIKCLIDEGIYINMNLLAGRSFTSADGLPASIDDMDWKDKQTPAMYYTEMINLQKEYASGLLSHVNPYTGRAMKDEPAVAFVEICNEHGLIHAWYNRQMDDDRLAAEFKTDLQAKWNTYLQGAYADHAALRSAWEISQPPGPEMLLNPDFASGTASWTFQEFAPADGTAAAEIDGHSPGLNAVHVTVTAAGSENWHIQLYQEGLDFTAGVPYTISFSAKADTDRDILMIIEQAEDPWMPMGVSKVLNLTDQWQRFEFTVMVSFSESNARLNFREMADEPGVYSFADVSCRQGGSIGLKSGEDLDAGTIQVFDYDDVGGRTEAAKSDWIDFLWGLEYSYWSQMNDYVKNTLGIQGLTIGTVIGNSTPNIMNIFDVIDSHGYFNHPYLPEGQQWSIVNETMADETDGGVVAGLSLKKVSGKPFSVTEYNHPFPITFDSEAFYFLGAYAALQDWDAIYPYTYDDGTLSWDINKQNGFFEHNRHPGKMASYISAALMFRRGDVSPAENAVTVPMSIAQEKDYLLSAGSWRLVDAEFAGMEKETGLIYRTEIVAEGGTNPPGALSPAGAAIPADDNFVSQTGELNWNASGAAKYMTVDTPNTKLVLGSTTGQTIDLSGYSISLLPNLQDWGVISMSVMEGESLTRNAKNILLTSHGAVSNTGLRYYDHGTGAEIPGFPLRGQSFYTQQWGYEPSIAEGIPCEIVVPYARDYVKVYALDNTGARGQSLPVSDENGYAKFAINDTYNTIWYEIEIWSSGPAPTDTFTATPTMTITPGGPSNTPTFTVTKTVTVEQLLIDDCEDADGVNSLGGYWYTYDDEYSEIHPAPDSFSMSMQGAQESLYAVRIYGNIAAPSPDNQYPYIGLGTSLDQAAGKPDYAGIDVAGYTGIKFAVKGDGAQYYIKLPHISSENGETLTEYDDYRYVFTAPDEWEVIYLPFTEFSQAGWTGISVDIYDVLADLKELQWQHTGNDTSFDLWIDDIAFYNASAPENTPEPTITVTPSLTPHPVFSFTNTPSATATNTAEIMTPTASITPVKKASENLEKVYVYPSLYNAASGERGITFKNLTNRVSIRIYNLKGEIVHLFDGSTLSGEYFWSIEGQRRKNRISPGIYIYVITDTPGNYEKGRLVVVR